MPKPRPPAPSDPPPPVASGQDQSASTDWRPEDPSSWGRRAEERQDWEPENEATWERAAQAMRARVDKGEAPPVGAPPWVVEKARRSIRRSSSGRSSSRPHHAHRKIPMQHRRGMRLRLKLTLFALALLVVGAGAVVADAYYQAYSVAAPLDNVAGNLNRARIALSRGKLPTGDPFTAAVDLADAAEQEVANARFTFDLVGRIPLLRRPIEVVRQQVVASREWAESATIARDMLVDLLGDQALQAEDLQQLEDREDVDPPVLAGGVVDIDLIERLAPRLESLIEHLEAADRAIRAMPSIPFVSRVDEQKTEALAESSASLEAARDALDGLSLLPGFLGTDGPKHYYMALQNVSDQRGTGGAVLAYGILRVERGAMTLIEAGGIEEIDNEDQGIRGVTLPEAVSWYIQAAGVNPRLANGANYTGDFPIVATAWSAMVEKATGIAIDGVIALDPFAISYALGSNTQINLESYEGTITGENALFVIANDQYRLDKPTQDLFVEELITAAWPKLQQPRPFVRKLQQLGVGLKERHIQLWTKDPELQDLIVRLDWDGALDRGTGDYLFLAHNKRNGNKVDYYLEQDVTYNVTIQRSGDISCEYRLELTGEVPEGEPPPIAGREGYGLNVAMENLFVPKEAEFVSVQPTAPVAYDSQPRSFVMHEEGAFLVLTRPVEVRPGDPKTVVFRYDVPGVIESGPDADVYRLNIQHQSMANPMTITVNVTLPEGAEPAPTEGWTITGNVATFTATLTTDLVTELAF